LSPLTKLFVGLLVVLSLLQSAGIIVFVNTVTDFKTSLASATDKADKATSEANRLRAEADTIRATADQQAQQAARSVDQKQQELNRMQQQLTSARADLAKASSDNQMQQVSITSLTGALNLSQNTTSAQQNQINELRAANDKFATQNEQLNLTVTDLTNKLDVTERERRYLAEQLTELRGTSEKQSAMLREMGVSSAQLASAGTRLSAPPINGVVRDVKSLFGIPYARISVGSADNVTKGMEFKVLSHDTGQFLGVLKVETVEQNEATGKLDGPGLAQIKAGADVKTQLGQ
jgi:hypothetical protein